MSDFKVIETQEQLDEIIRDRIARAEAKAAEKYADYDALKTQSEDKDKQIAALSEKLEKQNELKAGYDSKKSEHTKKMDE